MDEYYPVQYGLMQTCRASCAAALRRHPAIRQACFLVFCATGLLISFSAYAYVLEKLTIRQHKPNEFCLMFTCCLSYTILSYIAKVGFRETTTSAPLSVFVLLSTSTFASSYLSIRALRHVSYPIKVLGKTCKPIPIMMIGLCLGKTYPARKYWSIALITAGASLFIAANNRSIHHRDVNDSSWQGVLLLCLSLLCDGITGALEDRFIKQFRIGPFHLMHHINKCSALFATVAVLLVPSAAHDLIGLLQTDPEAILLLGIAGGFGQVFIFLTISSFGALTTSVLGSARKMLTILLSVSLFHHQLNYYQSVALVVVFVGMAVNLARRKAKAAHHDDGDRLDEAEVDRLMDDDDGGGSGIQMKRMMDPAEEPTRAFPDLSEALFADKDDATFSIAIDTVFRATTCS